MKILYADSETSGLSPFIHHITLFQHSWDDSTKITLTPNPSKEFIHNLFDKASLIVMHNASFDFGMAHYIPNANKIVDTAKLSRIIDFQEEEHTLDKVATRALGYDPYENYDKKRLQKTDWTQELTKEQLAYAKLDVQVLKPIFKKFRTALIHKIYKFDCQSMAAGLQIQQHGLPILHKEVKAEQHATEARLAALLDELPCNPNSPKQVTEALHVSSSADRVLAQMELKGNALAAQVREARQAGKYLNFLKKLGAKPRYYGTLGPNAASGRFTSSKENIQQIPRAQKRFIGSHDNVLISADYAQLELRSIAVLAKDKTMVNLFREGADLHAYTAEQLFGGDYTKEQRQIAKTFSFSILYGAGVRTIREMLIANAGIILPEMEVAQLKKRWLLAYKGIAQWQREGSKRFELGLPHHTPLGRKYLARSYTQMLAVENQGLGAEITRWALHYLLPRLPEEVKPVNYVHDSILIESPNDPAIYEPTANLVAEAFKKSWAAAPLNTYGVEMPVSVGVAHNWKDADSLTNCVFTLEEV